MQAVEIASVFFSTHLLELQQVGVEFIGAASQDDAARLVVGRDDDERFVGVLLIKLIGHLHRVVQINRFEESRRCVVGVAGIVNLSALNHQEETIFLLLLLREERDASTRDVLQRQVARLAVDGVRQTRAVVVAWGRRLQEDELLRLLTRLLELLVAAGDGVSRLLAALKQCSRSRGIFFVFWYAEIRAGTDINERSV